MTDDENISRRPRKIKASHDDVSTPSQDIVASNRKAPVTIVDDLGRPVKVKFLTLLDHMRITRVLGAELSKNDQYKMLATLAFCVIEFNGDVCPAPVTVREVEAMIDRLGDEGALAVGHAYSEAGWTRKPDDDSDAGMLDDAKN